MLVQHNSFNNVSKNTFLAQMSHSCGPLNHRIKPFELIKSQYIHNPFIMQYDTDMINLLNKISAVDISKVFASFSLFFISMCIGIRNQVN